MMGFKAIFTIKFRRPSIPFHPVRLSCHDVAEAAWYSTVKGKGQPSHQSRVFTRDTTIFNVEKLFRAYNPLYTMSQYIKRTGSALSPIDACSLVNQACALFLMIRGLAGRSMSFRRIRKV